MRLLPSEDSEKLSCGIHAALVTRADRCLLCNRARFWEITATEADLCKAVVIPQSFLRDGLHKGQGSFGILVIFSQMQVVQQGCVQIQMLFPNRYL